MQPNGTTTTNQPVASYEVGYVTSIKNYLITLSGLPKVRVNEIVESDSGSKGLVIALKESAVEVVLLDATRIQPGQRFKRTYTELSLPVGPDLIGRTINPLGTPIDGKGRLPEMKDAKPLFKVASGIGSREFIKEQLSTGITLVDTLIPLAKGQRQLIIGSAKSGKGSFLINLVVNQGKIAKLNNIVVIYVLIGKPLTETRRLVDILGINKAMDYSVVVGTSSADPASLIYISPFAGFAAAEYFQAKGFNVVLVLDDLGIHAKYYREIALLSNRPPGRESYPGDIFSLHASLLERGGHFKKEFGGSSITVLPIIETPVDDLISFIPTNLMAMTDGHLFFDANLNRRGIRPSIDVAASVSRVGRQTQTPITKLLADKIRKVLAESHKVESLSRFGSEVSLSTQLILNQGKQIEHLLNQPALFYLPFYIQLILIGLPFTSFFMQKNATFIENNKSTIIEYLSKLNEKEAADKLNKLKTEAEFFAVLNQLMPEIQRICK